MACVEHNVHEVLDGLHRLKTWVLVRSVFLLDTFHEHSAIRSTAIEPVLGHKHKHLEKYSAEIQFAKSGVVDEETKTMRDHDGSYEPTDVEREHARRRNNCIQ